MISQSTRYSRRAQPRRGGGGIVALLCLVALFAAVQVAYWHMGMAVLGMLGHARAGTAVLLTLTQVMYGLMRGLPPIWL